VTARNRQALTPSHAELQRGHRPNNSNCNTGFTPVAYDAAAAPADFTASDGATGQPYVLAGAPASAATQALAPSTGGEVPAGAAAGGANPADPGLAHASAGDPVDTENGDFTQSGTDVSVPGFGPALDFTRSYDAQAAQQQAQARAPGAMGYGWTDNWATSLAATRPVPGDIYAMGGLRTNNGNGGSPASQPMLDEGAVVYNGGNTYIADVQGDRVLEVAGATGTQWGIPMTAGDMYVIAGSASGIQGDSPNGTPAASSLLVDPQGLAVDGSGNLYIADTGNNRVVEIPATAGQNRGFGAMTAGDLYTIAGSAAGTAGHSGDGGAAASALLSQPFGLATGPGNGDVYVADSGNSRVQEIPAAGGSQWGQPMTAYGMYTVAGSAAGTAGISGDGGAATAGYLSGPDGITLSSAGDLYVADTGNNRIQEVSAASGAQWGITPAFTAGDMYTVAGSAAGSSGHSANGTTAASALLDQPTGVIAGNGTQLYIADNADNRVEEVARSAHAEWGISMTVNAIYTIAGTGNGFFYGDGGLATSAALHAPMTVALDGSFNLYIADGSNLRVREISAATGDISTFAGDGYTLYNNGNGGPAVTAGLHTPSGVASDAMGDVFIADSSNNRVQEIAASTHAQFGISMTAGDVYTVAGSGHGSAGLGGDAGPATAAFITSPQAIAVDTAGDLYIADTGNNRVQEVAAGTGTQWGQSMTAGDVYTVAGSAAGVSGLAGDGGPAASALLNSPAGVAVDGAGDLLIADEVNNRVQEVPAAAGSGMTAGDMYTIAGSAAGTAGSSGDGGAAQNGLLRDPAGVTADPAGDVLIADSANNRIQEIPAKTGAQRGQAMTAGDIYTAAGSAAGTSGLTGDGGPAGSAGLNGPDGVTADSSGDLYIADTGNNRIQEVAAASGTQWSQQMTAGDIYTAAGLASGIGGIAGNGGPAAAAHLWTADSVAVDPAGNLYITDAHNNALREVVSTAGSPFAVSPAPAGLTITQPGGAQVTFYPQSGGTCTAPYVTAGGYCALPQDTGATLTYSSGNGGTYTFTPAPGTSYVYASSGALRSESDTAGNTLTVSYATPLPGSGNYPASAATCQTITSAAGRSLVIGSNTGGLVTSVTDPMGRRWAYGYTGSDLTSVTDPMTNITTYAYGQGSTGNPLLASDLLTITSPNAQPGGPDAGDATVNVYDSSGRVTSQTDPAGWKTTFNYCASPAAGNCLNTATGTGTVTVTDPDGNITIDDYQQGALAAESNWTSGTTLTSEQDNVPDLTAGGTSGGTLLDTATADGNGNLTTYTYDPAGNTTSTTAPDGAGNQTATTTDWSTALDNTSCAATAQAASSCSSSQAGPAPVAPGGAITPPSSAPPQGITYTLYDTDGNKLYDTTGVYEPGSNTAAYSQTTYHLFKGNSITLSGTHITCTAAPPAPSLPCADINPNGVVTQLAYNPQGDLISSSTPDGNGTQLATTTYAYDGGGEQTTQIAPDGNVSGGNLGNYTTVTAWNADGEKTSVTQAGGSGATVTPRATSYGHDGDGNQITVKDARGYTTTTAYNPDDEADLVTDPQGHATLTCYDGDGNVTQTVPPSGVASGSLTPASCPTAYPAGYQNRLLYDATAYTFDADGNNTETTTPPAAGQSGHPTTTYTYDGEGNVLITTAPPAKGLVPQVTSDTYNSAGKIATETAGYGTAVPSTTSYCYNPNGDQTAIVMPDGNTSAVAPCQTSSPWAVSSGSDPAQAAYQTTSSYDSARELVSTTSPATTAAQGGATTSYTYDPAGNKLTSADPAGVTTTWTYTPANLAATISYSGSSAHSVTYGYDADGNKTAMTDATGSSTYLYDPFGELASATNGAGKTIGYVLQLLLFGL